MENIDQSIYERADEGLLRLIEKAKIGALSEKEHRIYEASLKALEDEVDMEETGYERGLEEGLFIIIKKTQKCVFFCDLFIFTPLKYAYHSLLSIAEIHFDMIFLSFY